MSEVQIILPLTPLAPFIAKYEKFYNKFYALNKLKLSTSIYVHQLKPVTLNKGLNGVKVFSVIYPNNALFSKLFKRHSNGGTWKLRSVSTISVVTSTSQTFYIREALW